MESGEDHWWTSHPWYPQWYAIETGSENRKALRVTAAASTSRALPYLTADLPGVGGVIKRFNEDFAVEELPLYPACGSGTHMYFLVEKQGLTTPAAIDQIARALGKPRRDVGYAGQKDAHGVTRQWFSVEHVDESRVEAIGSDRLRVLSVTRHTNKLKLGHLAGNRFIVLIREIGADALERARRIVEMLARVGIPNYFGPQRFGVRGDNAAIGEAVLKDDFETAVALVLGRPGDRDHGPARRAREAFDAGDIEESVRVWQRGFPQQAKLGRALIGCDGNAAKAWRTVDHTMRKFYISAFQSELFNQVVAKRIGTLARVSVGDIAWKHVNGACFRVEDAAVEQPRCDAFEISPTGPLFGPRMTDAGGETGLLEAAILATTGLTKDQIRATDGSKLAGERRALRVPLHDASVEPGEDPAGRFLKLSFSLPSGCFATTVTRELCKTEVAES